MKKEMIEKISKKLGDEYEVKEVTVQKTNGTRNGIQVAIKAYPQVGATFYQNANISVDENVDGIVDAVYQELTSERIREVLRVTEILKDKDFVRSHLQIKMVNYEMNKDWLQDAIYEPILDLAAVVYLVLNEDGDSSESITLKKDILTDFGLSEEEVLELAKRNIPDEPEILDLLNAAICSNGDEMEPGMYVMTNHAKLNGASCMLSPAIKKMAEVNKIDLIIIPSSIHEIILMITEDSEMDKEFVNQMIQSVNAECVSQDEILSDHAYVFRRETNQLEIL